MPTKVEKDSVTGVETTGHEWDGIRELNNPLPKWWLYVFYVTIVFSLVYWVLFPSIPLGTSYFAGLTGYSARMEAVAAYEQGKADQGVFREQIAALEPAAIKDDPQLLNFALAGGSAAFADNCAACHAQGGAGQAGVYPALVDDDWLWGGSLEAIQHTIAYGVRNLHPDSRYNVMPAYDWLTAEELHQVSEHVLSLSGRAEDAAAAKAGSEIFLDNCSSCHGEAGQGIADLGAPNLSDAIWLYGGTKDEILAQLNAPKHGVMPHWYDRLDEETIKMLTVYVHSLGGGE